MTGPIEQQCRIEKRRSIRIRRSKLLQSTEGIEYKIASSTEELEQAYNLVTQQYISVGFQNKQDQLRLTKYHLLPESKVFIAIKKIPHETDRVVGTLTLVKDTAMGLPMDEVYENQLNRLRISGLQLAEVIGLAIATSDSNLQNNLIMYLFKICLQYAQLSQTHNILCSVTKKHIQFYQELLLFKAVGEPHSYSYANNQVIQGHQINLQQASKEYKDVYSGMEFDADIHRFFFTNTPEYQRPYGKGEAMNPEQMRYFIEQRTQLLSSLTKQDKNILRHEFIRQDKAFAY